MHLNKFTNQAAYDAGKYDMDFPAVALVGTDIVYNPDPIIDYSKQYLTFEFLESGQLNLKGNNWWDLLTVKYSKDKTNWTTTVIEANIVNIPVTSGEKVYLSIVNDNYYYEGGVEYIRINSQASHRLSGNIMSVLYGDDFMNHTELKGEFTFGMLFDMDLGLVSAENLILPSMTLTQSCYRGMFSNCPRLETGPMLPAFELADYCYMEMFSGCTSLTAAPALPATTLVEECYYNMFNGCTSLNSVTCLATSFGINTDNCYNWLYNVSATGTFTKAAGSSWTTGASGIPIGWTVQDYSA